LSFLQQFTSYFGFIYGLVPAGNLVPATRIGGEAIIGDNFEFYHGATIGGNNGLRGYRNERFNGKYSLYHNIDLRLRLGKSKASFSPVKYGLTAGFDYGRVWIEDDDSNKWHNNIGGSFWLSRFESFTGNIGYYHSTEGGRVSFTLGFEF
jgi:outer membrane protein assembly factor BamA